MLADMRNPGPDTNWNILIDAFCDEVLLKYVMKHELKLLNQTYDFAPYSWAQKSNAYDCTSNGLHLLNNFLSFTFFTAKPKQYPAWQVSYLSFRT